MIDSLSIAVHALKFTYLGSNVSSTESDINMFDATRSKLMLVYWVSARCYRMIMNFFFKGKFLISYCIFLRQFLHSLALRSCRLFLLVCLDSFLFRFYSCAFLSFVFFISWRMQRLVWFGLVSLFNGISTFVGYLIPKSFS